MANALYPKARQAFARAEIDYDVDDIVLLLVDNTYVYDAAHEFLDDVAGTAIVATSPVFTGKDSTDGILDAADVTLPAVTGDDVVGVIIVQDTGVAGTSHLIAYFDSTSSSVLIDVPPDGSDLRVRWSDGANKILRL